MPSSDPCNIPVVLAWAKRARPRTILDVGVGCGKYGVLFREYLDGHRQGRAFHDRGTWNLSITGVEIFPGYLTPVHSYAYDRIHIGDVRDLVRRDELFVYDLIVLGDVLEHFTKEEGARLIHALRERHLEHGGVILVSTPNFKSDFRKRAPFGNRHERHRCRWYRKDFEQLGMRSDIDEGRLLTVALREKEHGN